MAKEHIVINDKLYKCDKGTNAKIIELLEEAQNSTEDDYNKYYSFLYKIEAEVKSFVLHGIYK